VEQIEELRARLYRELLAEGLRMTAPRRAVLALLLERVGETFSADDITAQLNAREPGSVSRATVYRTLELLADGGMLRRDQQGARQSFSLHSSAGSSVRLIDPLGGRVTELSALPALERFLARIVPEGFKAQRAVLEVYGRFDKPLRKKPKKR
jgi:Fe2+ or Zn2+ uptake regulation protein